jgi:hypothetical protein
MIATIATFRGQGRDKDKRTMNRKERGNANDRRGDREGALHRSFARVCVPSPLLHGVGASPACKRHPFPLAFLLRHPLTCFVMSASASI